MLFLHEIERVQSYKPLQFAILNEGEVYFAWERYKDGVDKVQSVTNLVFNKDRSWHSDADTQTLSHFIANSIPIDSQQKGIYSV